MCSPSYTLVNVYKGRVPVFHIDLYRLEKESEILDLGWDDYLGEGVVIIEWAEKLPFPVDGIRVAIEPGADDIRTITIRRRVQSLVIPDRGRFGTRSFKRLTRRPRPSLRRTVTASG